MKTIWKYDLEGNVAFEMPKGAEVISVQVQHRRPCMWAVVDTEAPKETRNFTIFGTGHGIPKDFFPAKHIGTFQMADGALIWHVFEKL